MVRYLGGHRPDYNHEDEADYLCDLTEKLCREWAKLSNEQEDARMELEKKNPEACKETVGH